MYCSLWVDYDPSHTVHFTEVGPKQEQNLPREPACWEDSTAIRLWNPLWQANNKQQLQQTPICLSGSDQEKGLNLPQSKLAPVPGLGLLNKSCEQRLSQVLHCQPWDVLSSPGAAAQCEWPLNSRTAFHSDLVWFKEEKKKSHQTGVLLCFTKAVLCWLQVQDSWAIRRGKMDSVLACVDKENRHSWEWRPQQVASVRDTYLASS